MSSTKIQSITMGSIYADDFQKSFEFYSKILGLEGQPGENSCFFQLNKEQAIYVEGGYNRAPATEKPVCSAITFKVDSVYDMMKKLNDARVKIIQNEPLKMAENLYWLQCYDPSGNIVEFLGGK
jgi:predicted enzyme related to lactoylglutathione lyase